MANAKAAPAPADDKAAAAGKGVQRKTLMLVIVGVVVLVLIAGGVAVALLLRKPAAKPGDAAAAAQTAEENKAPAQYLDLQPSFVVNLEDDQAMRYLQVDIELMTRDPKAMEQIKNNMPRIRNTLMLLLSAQHSKDLMTREGKEALEKQALDQVQAVMRDETGKPEVEGLYFTNFVMQ